MKIGDTAPDFTALDDSNRKVRLQDFRGRHDDTPGCTQEACDRHAAFAAPSCWA